MESAPLFERSMYESRLAKIELLVSVNKEKINIRHHPLECDRFLVEPLDY